MFYVFGYQMVIWSPVPAIYVSTIYTKRVLIYRWLSSVIKRIRYPYEGINYVSNVCQYKLNLCKYIYDLNIVDRWHLCIAYMIHSVGVNLLTWKSPSILNIAFDRFIIYSYSLKWGLEMNVKPALSFPVNYISNKLVLRN